MKVSISILKEKNNINQALRKINETNADYVHLDIMDGTFTDNSSFDLLTFKNLSQKKYDVHIMSTNLEYQINEAIKINPEYITFHVEATKDVLKYINLIKSNNIKVGLAINPKTRISKIKKYLNIIDQVLVMSVVPGKGGQKFIPSTLKKIKKLNYINGTFEIAVDGGINDETVLLVKDYVDTIVTGSFVTDSNNYQERISLLKN